MKKLELWLGFIKFTFGTVVLGLVTIFVNKDIQDKEITLKEMEQKRAIELREQEQLGTFIIQAIDEDVGVRFRFSQYFATVTRSQDLRERWVAYNTQVEKEFNGTQLKRDELQKKIQEENLAPPEFVDAIKKLDDFDRQLSTKQSRVNNLPSLFSLKLTDNFSLGDFVESRVAARAGIDNTPNGTVVRNLYKLSENVLEPLMKHFRSKVLVVGGYRSKDLNQLLGGKANSQHLTGNAVDIRVEGHSNCEVARWISQNLEFDYLELAFVKDGDGTWVGVSFVEGKNRKQVVTSSALKGLTVGLECGLINSSGDGDK